MVQNCCSKYVNCVGQVMCIVFCCTCCKKKKKLEEHQQNIELSDSSRPQIIPEYNADDGSIYNGSSTYDTQYVIRRQPISNQPNSELRDTSRPQTVLGSNADNESIYNGSSTYDSQYVIRQQPHSESGVYMSESSLYSGSITDNPSDIKLEFSCEIKGTVDVGGIPQPVKGVLSIVPDEINKRPLPDKPIYAVNAGLTNNVNLRHKSSRTDSLKNQQTRSIHRKTPQPMPRTVEPDKNRASEMYFYKQSSMNNEATETLSEADEGYYNEPKPPLPVKKRNTQDPTAAYVPVYENFVWKTSNVKTTSLIGNNQQNTDLKSSSEDTPVTNNGHQEEHIYEDINPKYQGPYTRKHKSDDYEIYMP